MSVTYNLACVDCKKFLWVGQRGAGSTAPWLYKGREPLKALTSFLNEHQGHALKYVNGAGLEDGDYEEVDGLSKI